MRDYRNGFTLIELLIVIVMIGVLATVGISVVDPVTQFQKARDAQRKSDLSQIQKAFEVYHQDYGNYPNEVGYVIEKADEEDAPVRWGDSWLPYMSVLPKDPVSSRNYVYVVGDNRQTYYLYVSLERGAKDPQVCYPEDGSKCENAPADACSSTGSDPKIICNYGVSSPNVSP